MEPSQWGWLFCFGNRRYYHQNAASFLKTVLNEQTAFAEFFHSALHFQVWPFRRCRYIHGIEFHATIRWHFVWDHWKDGNWFAGDLGGAVKWFDNKYENSLRAWRLVSSPCYEYHRQIDGAVFSSSKENSFYVHWLNSSLLWTLPITAYWTAYFQRYPNLNPK